MKERKKTEKKEMMINSFLQRKSGKSWAQEKKERKTGEPNGTLIKTEEQIGDKVFSAKEGRERQGHLVHNKSFKLKPIFLSRVKRFTMHVMHDRGLI